MSIPSIGGPKGTPHTAKTEKPLSKKEKAIVAAGLIALRTIAAAFELYKKTVLLTADHNISILRSRETNTINRIGNKTLKP